MKFIKDILTSNIYRRYWPEMIHEEEGKRERWTTSEISVDHPLRKAEAVRDPTVFTAGLTTGIVGLHCDIAVLDDTVVGDNAYSAEGRDKVQTQYSFLASIEGAESKEWVVGTRYHPLDLYAELISTTVDQYSPDGELTDEVEPLYEVFERVVEDSPSRDGTGQFLWPKQLRSDGKSFGFDLRVLATKRSKYLDKTQFYAQYYNDPNDLETAEINRDWFQYYDKQNVQTYNGSTYMAGRRLNVFAAIDFAASTTSKADHTALVVVGVDSHNNYYVLDIARFKTDSIKTYFDNILTMFRKWGFRRMSAEVTSFQSVIVKDIKDNYIRPYGLALSVIDSRPVKDKAGRIRATLNARYENRQMFHYRGGNCEVLENELVLQNPPHDDIKDCLAQCIAIAIAPSNDNTSASRIREAVTNTRFGGIN